MLRPTQPSTLSWSFGAIINCVIIVGAVICLLAADCGSSCLLAVADCIVFCGVISSCQSAATSETVKHSSDEFDLCSSAKAST